MNRRGLLKLLGTAPVWQSQLMEPFSYQTSNSNDWSSFQNDKINSGYNSSAKSLNSPIGQDWSIEFNNRTFSPVIAGDVVYFGSGSQFHAVNIDNGSGIWSYEMEGSTASLATVADDTALIGDSERVIYALDADSGSKLWTHKTDELNDSVGTPNISGGTAFFPMLNGVLEESSKLYAMSVADGTVRWKTSVDNHALRHSPAIGDNSVYVANSNGKVFSLNQESGEENWNLELSGNCVQNPVTLSNSRLFVNTDDYLYAVDTVSGSVRWKYATGMQCQYSSPAIAGGQVFFGTQTGDVYSLNTDDGSEIWNYESNDNTVFYSPAVVDNLAYFVAHDFSNYVGHIYGFNISDGSVEHELEVEYELRGSPAISDKKLFAGSENGAVISVNKQNERPSASFTYSPESPVVDEPVRFDASESMDPDGEIMEYNWDMTNNGEVDLTGEVVSYAFTTAGPQTVQLEVIDDSGGKNTASEGIRVEERATPTPTDTPTATPTDTPTTTPTDTENSAPTQTVASRSASPSTDTTTAGTSPPASESPTPTPSPNPTETNPPTTTPPDTPESFVGFLKRVAGVILSTEALLIEGAAILAAIIWSTWPEDDEEGGGR